MRNVSKPSHLGNGHVLNSRVVLIRAKILKTCFCYKLDPKHSQNFIEIHNFKHCKQYIRVHTRMLIPARIGGTYMYMCAHSVSDQKTQKTYT